MASRGSDQRPGGVGGLALAPAAVASQIAIWYGRLVDPAGGRHHTGVPPALRHLVSRVQDHDFDCFRAAITPRLIGIYRCIVTPKLRAAL